MGSVLNIPGVAYTDNDEAHAVSAGVNYVDVIGVSVPVRTKLLTEAVAVENETILRH